MAFGFDSSIILSSPRVNPHETMRTLADLANAAQSRRQGQAQLDAMAREQQRASTLADIYRQHATSPQALPTALLQGGFGTEAFAAQDQQAQMEKQRREGEAALAEYQRAQEKRIGDLFYGVKDQTAWARAREQVPEAFRAKIPEAFDPVAAQQLASLAVPAEKRAQFDATAAENAKRRAFDASEAEKERAARAAADRAKGEKEATKEVAAATTSLRKEFNSLPEVKEFKGIEAAYRGVKSSVKDMTGTGSTATIFSFMKMIDPGVAVMEGDVERIRASGGPAAQYADLYNSVLTGNSLPPEVRKAIEARADDLYAIRKQTYDEAASRYRTFAAKAGADPNDVAPKKTPSGKPYERMQRNEKTGAVRYLDGSGKVVEVSDGATR